MARNIGSSKITAVILYFLFNKYGKFLDYGGGLRYIAQKYNMNISSNGRNIHILILTKNKKINNKLFNLLLKFQRFGLFFYVKKKIKSLTVDDMDLLISIMKNKR